MLVELLRFIFFKFNSFILHFINLLILSFVFNVCGYSARMYVYTPYVFGSLGT